jgi:uncharacterized membrane protein YvbJ
MAETIKCPACGSEVESAATNCTKCNIYIRNELETLRDIEASTSKVAKVLNSVDASLKTIKGIVLWWLILSILAVLATLAYVISKN